MTLPIKNKNKEKEPLFVGIASLQSSSSLPLHQKYLLASALGTAVGVSNGMLLLFLHENHIDAGMLSWIRTQVFFFFFF